MAPMLEQGEQCEESYPKGGRSRGGNVLQTDHNRHFLCPSTAEREEVEKI